MLDSEKRCASEGPVDFPNSTPRRAMLAGMAGIAAGALLTRGAKAGPLNPPAGPVTSTGKTLTEVEPRIAINQTNTPGSANSVFRITQPGSYYLTGNVLGESGKNGILIESADVTVDLNGFALIGAAGSLAGITGSLRQTICNGLIRNWGSSGISVGDNSRFWDLTVASCVESGIVGGSGCIIERCLLRNNIDNGILVGFGAVIRGCTAVSNGIGITTQTSCTIVDSVATSNIRGGIETSASIVSRCTVTFNNNFGIKSLGRTIVEHCNASANSGRGIEVTGFRNVIAENICTTNSGTGLLVEAASSQNRIDGNHFTTNGFGGMRVLSTLNIIVRNSSRANTSFNYDIAAGNDAGPIQTAATATSPWANL